MSRTDTTVWVAPLQPAREREREAVRFAQRKLGVFQRRACTALGMSRSTMRYVAKLGEFTRRLRDRILELVAKYPRSGHRRACKLLRREGWDVNRKRVHRLWKKEGLCVPKKVRRRRRRGYSENACHRWKATHRNHVWTLDFAWDVTEDGLQLKFLPIVDEYTRECLALRGVAPLYIAPASPWENGYGESFIGRFRDEHLDRELFTSLLEAQVVTEDWRIE